MSDGDRSGDFFDFLGGLSIPVPKELAERLARKHDQEHMMVEAAMARLDAFLTGLDVDGLLSLRLILGQNELASSPTANFWDGQCVALLRYVHHVDPGTGKDPLAAIAEDGG